MTTITIITVFAIVVIMMNVFITTIMKAKPDRRKLSLLRTSEMFQGCLQCQFDFYINEDHIGGSYFSRGAHRRSALERHGRDQLPTSESSEGCRSFLILSHHYHLQQNLHQRDHIRQDIILIVTKKRKDIT